MFCLFVAFIPGDLGFLGKYDPNQYFKNLNNKKAWKQTWDGSWPNTGESKNEQTTIETTSSELNVETHFGNTANEEQLIVTGHGNHNQHGKSSSDSDTAKSWAEAWKQEMPGQKGTKGSTNSKESWNGKWSDAWPGVPESKASITDTSKTEKQGTDENSFSHSSRVLSEIIAMLQKLRESKHK
ncbi:uncharacterized protein LOC127738709 isoform X2 [Mytilus californianus]|uniref:uncharacterized protein LOC127738709 isoform X2 n=1 Tax=Mytilus californianus TaxID=6549 RepID=UPI0022475A62|nr:uncharacterized protein LOC127738709 isoform X2 [Mytilus californianus]